MCRRSLFGQCTPTRWRGRSCAELREIQRSVDGFWIVSFVAQRDLALVLDDWRLDADGGVARLGDVREDLARLVREALAGA